MLDVFLLIWNILLEQSARYKERATASFLDQLASYFSEHEYLFTCDGDRAMRVTGARAPHPPRDPPPDRGDRAPASER
ncbi:unnamed protein product [Euphydryas editha]|uniref:Uncharacterized protein n=1 Tax=Euphydryas editha TaxID=104508 RepID=A0AAU9UES6_EUPED|nr:unnamed protein product [Euphydryas editha]